MWSLSLAKRRHNCITATFTESVVWRGIEGSIRPSGTNFINQEMDKQEAADRTVQYSELQFMDYEIAEQGDNVGTDKGWNLGFGCEGGI
jgi:hypothetical protein